MNYYAEAKILIYKHFWREFLKLNQTQQDVVIGKVANYLKTRLIGVTQEER